MGSFPHLITTWLVSHLLSIVGFLLAIVLLSRVLKERRAPGSTFAWLLAIGLMPYLGVPLYLIFGGRKLRRRAASKQKLYPATREAPIESARALERMLCSAGAPHAVAAGEVRLLATGASAYETILETLRAATTTIHVATFILGDDEVGTAVVDCLIEKARAGLEVRLLLDALFSRRPDHKRLDRLTAAGGKVAFFMPILHVPFRGHGNLRNHRKMIIVDGATAIIGGMNLAHEYMGPTEDPARWRDLSVRFEGAAATSVEEVFVSDWQFATTETLTVAPARAAATGDETAAQLIASGPDAAADTIYDALLTALFTARERVWIATPYFIPDEALTLAVVLAVRRGVDVRIVVPARSNHWLADVAGGTYLRQIQAAGGHVRPFLPGMLHAKVFVVDGEVGILGSANLDMRSLFLDYEIAAFFYSPREIATLAAWFDDVLASCGDRLADAGRARAVAEDLGRLLGPLV